MAKNMTRKGLALGAAASLVSVGLTGLPAAAAPALTVALAAGTSYNMISGEQLDVKVYSNAEYTWTASSDVKWEVVNADEVTVTAKTDNGATLPAATSASASPSATSATITFDGGTAGTDAGDNRLGLAVPADETTSLKVRAYIELDGTAGATAGDLISNQVTLNFIEAADITATLTIDEVYEDDQTVTASFSTNVNNEQLARGDFAVYFTDGLGADLAGATLDSSDDIADLETLVVPSAWDADDMFVATTGTVTALDKDTAVKAVLLYNDGGVRADEDIAADTATNDGTTDNDYNLPLVQDPNDTDVNTEVATATLSVLAATTGTVVLDTKATATSNTSDEFASGDSTVTIEATVEDADGDARVGVTVEFTLGNSSITLGTTDTAKKLSINGVTYTDGTKLPGDTDVAAVTAVTDADGVATLVITTDNFAANDALKIDAKYGTKAATQLTVTAKDVAYKAYVTNANDYYYVVSGGSAVLDVLVIDQFGGLLPAGYDARALYQSSDGFTSTGETDSSADSDVAAAITNGRVSLGITPDGVGTGTTVYDIDIQKRAAGNSYETAVAEITTFTIESVSALVAADTIALDLTEANYGDDATTDIVEIVDADGDSNTDADSDGTKTNDPQDLELADFVDFKAIDVLGATAPTVNAGFALDLKVTKAATATSAASNAGNQLVTLTSDAGDLVMFIADQDQNGDSTVEKTYGQGSVSAYTDKDGNLDVDVHSNKAGKVVITITAGGATQQVSITFAPAASTAGASLVIDAPDFVAPGSTVIAKATLKDKYGNPVKVTANTSTSEGDFKAAYDGPGLMVGSLPEATDASGLAQVAYFLGANDSGSITVTFSYDQNGDEDYTDDDDLTVQKTIVIGTSSADVTTWTKKLDDTSLKMYAKNVIGAGKVQFKVNGDEIAWTRANDVDDVEGASLRTANGAYYLVRTVDDRYLVSGRNVLTIVVDGVTTTTRIFYMD